jgi:hypothetical protein
LPSSGSQRFLYRFERSANLLFLDHHELSGIFLQQVGLMFSEELAFRVQHIAPLSYRPTVRFDFMLTPKHLRQLDNVIELDSYHFAAIARTADPPYNRRYTSAFRNTVCI